MNSLSMDTFDFSPYKAVIFDMDGLIIDSEPYWKIAEKTIFGKYGLHLTDDLLRQVMGFRLSEVVAYWYQYQPWPQPNFKQTEEEILTLVQSLILKHAEALPGIIDLFHLLKKHNYKIAIASSSNMSLIEAVVQKLNLGNVIDLLWSAQYEDYGKPHPAIFINTAHKLGLKLEDCLVLEDSINGVIAAKAARMKCIAIPETATFNDPRFAIADTKVKSATELLTATKL